jgi:hypothetical protein
MAKCKRYMKTIIVSILLVLLCCITSIEAKIFKVASYNVEKLRMLRILNTPILPE